MDVLQQPSTPPVETRLWTRTRLLRLINVAIGIAIIFWAVHLFGTRAVLDTVARSNWTLLVLAAVAWSCMGVLMAVRLRIILASLGHRVGLGRTVLANAAAILLSDITPGRIGYFSIVPHMAREGVRPGTTLAVVTGSQVIDFGVKVAAAGAFLAYVIAFVPLTAGARLLLFGAVGTLLVGTLVAGWLIWGGRARLLRPVLAAFPGGSAIADRFGGMGQGIREIRAHIPLMIAVSAGGLLLGALQWWLVAQAAGVALPFYLFLMLHPIVTALTFVPVSIAGLGIQEGGLGFALSLLGVAPAASLALALLIRVTTLASDLPGLIYFVTKE